MMKGMGESSSCVEVLVIFNAINMTKSENIGFPYRANLIERCGAGGAYFAYSCNDRSPFLVLEMAALLTSWSRRPNSWLMRAAATVIQPSFSFTLKMIFLLY
jgi:hypothetical protein